MPSVESWHPAPAGERPAPRPRESRRHVEGVDAAFGALLARSPAEASTRSEAGTRERTAAADAVRRESVRHEADRTRASQHALRADDRAENAAARDERPASGNTSSATADGARDASRSTSNEGAAAGARGDRGVVASHHAEEARMSGANGTNGSTGTGEAGSRVAGPQAPGEAATATPAAQVAGSDPSGTRTAGTQASSSGASAAGATGATGAHDLSGSALEGVAASGAAPGDRASGSRPASDRASADPSGGLDLANVSEPSRDAAFEDGGELAGERRHASGGEGGSASSPSLADALSAAGSSRFATALDGARQMAPLSSAASSFGAGGSAATIEELPGAFVRVLGAHGPRGERTAVIRLEPADLGSIRVRLQVGETEVRAFVEAEHASTADILRELREPLERALARSGLTLEKFEVQTASRESVDGRAFGAQSDARHPGAEDEASRRAGRLWGIGTDRTRDGSVRDLDPAAFAPAGWSGLDVRV